MKMSIKKNKRLLWSFVVPQPDLCVTQLISEQRTVDIDIIVVTRYSLLSDGLFIGRT